MSFNVKSTVTSVENGTIQRNRKSLEWYICYNNDNIGNSGVFILTENTLQKQSECLCLCICQLKKKSQKITNLKAISQSQTCQNTPVQIFQYVTYLCNFTKLEKNYNRKGIIEK